MKTDQSQLQITRNFLPYNAQLDPRSKQSIKRVVIHCTELPDLKTARQYGEHIHHLESGTGHSGHYYIERDGSVHQWVELERIAHHAAAHNADSIGIELINLGRYPDWHHSEHQVMTQSYTGDQIQALIVLINTLKTEIPGLEQITGHQHLDQRKIPASDQPQLEIFRKLDPGPLFPWQQVLAATGLTGFDD